VIAPRMVARAGFLAGLGLRAVEHRSGAVGAARINADLVAEEARAAVLRASWRHETSAPAATG
jgi:hypothetical protein